MDEVDDLLAKKVALRAAIGDDVAKAIEQSPDEYSDADAFRIYHAKARFRATLETIGAVVVVPSLLAPRLGFASGRQMLSHHSTIAMPVVVGTWIVSYKFWQYVVGWTP